MPTWIRFCLGSLWVGAMGFCLINAPRAADELSTPASTSSELGSTAPVGSENPSPEGSAGQLVPNRAANRALEKAAEKKIEPSNQATSPTLKKSATRKSSAETGKEYTLLPKMRVEAGGDTQSKGIEIDNLKAFLRFGLFMTEACFLQLPRVTYAQDAHILSADRDLIYSSKVEGSVGDTVYIYRTGKRYYEPKTKEFLGYMAFKAAEAQILEKQNTEKQNNIVMQVKHNLEPVDKTMRITKSDWPPILSLHYLKPVLIDNTIEGYIIDVWDPGITLIAKNTAVVLSVGTRDGVSVGNLLEIYRSKDLLDSSISQKGSKDRPEIRVGRVLVYQVDEKMSLGLITEIYEKIVLFDKIRGEVLEMGEDECAPKNLDAHFFDNTCCAEDACAEDAENKTLGEVLEEMTQSSTDEVCVEDMDRPTK